MGEHHARSGVRLDTDTLPLHYKAVILSTAICTILPIVVDLLPRFSDADYRSMADRYDRKLQESGMSSAIIRIDSVLRERLDAVMPGDAWRRIVAGEVHDQPKMESCNGDW